MSAPSPTPIRCVLFDLDGTLLDTAPDLAGALNALRAEEGLAPLPYARLRPLASHGAARLLAAGFDLGPQHAAFERLRTRFLALYRAMLAEATVPFPGIGELLDALDARGLAWGVVTNKPGWLTTPLLAALGLAERAACVVAGDTLAVAKPDPAPLLHACALAGVPATACVYVGDAARDIEAGRRAGMRTLVARFGYIGADDRPEDWQADGGIDHPLELLDWLAGAIAHG
ncbi:phosphoglycolate phosphatase [Plasticicumulans lactativorans]|uniref:Phosphoglycolate phosphatase n=1 Tax=Plasticicumulans lactativorans TaxID=1133106 RepID=A0A4R2LFN2_9GAMM|nr:phosphoglycolate phosphatase [Plasticicumulans lactativorans]TCO83504.1 phosphoglycolate phosphatase [Plasticicumulans lactativorans]